MNRYNFSFALIEEAITLSIMCIYINILYILNWVNFIVIPQDSANKNGGKWIVRLRKGLASRCWENMILAMLGEQFMVGDEICGAVISVRFQVSLKYFSDVLIRIYNL